MQARNNDAQLAKETAKVTCSPTHLYRRGIRGMIQSSLMIQEKRVTSKANTAALLLTTVLFYTDPLACVITVQTATFPKANFYCSPLFFLQTKHRAKDVNKKKSCFFQSYSYHKFTVVVLNFCCSYCVFLPLFPSPFSLLLVRLTYSSRRNCSIRSARRGSASQPATGGRLRSTRPRQKISTEG